MRFRWLTSKILNNNSGISRTTHEFIIEECSTDCSVAPFEHAADLRLWIKSTQNLFHSMKLSSLTMRSCRVPHAATKGKLSISLTGRPYENVITSIWYASPLLHGLGLPSSTSQYIYSAPQHGACVCVRTTCKCVCVCVCIFVLYVMRRTVHHTVWVLSTCQTNWAKGKFIPQYIYFFFWQTNQCRPYAVGSTLRGSQFSICDTSKRFEKRVAPKQFFSRLHTQQCVVHFWIDVFMSNHLCAYEYTKTLLQLKIHTNINIFFYQF